MINKMTALTATFSIAVTSCTIMPNSPYAQNRPKTQDQIDAEYDANRWQRRSIYFNQPSGQRPGESFGDYQIRLFGTGAAAYGVAKVLTDDGSREIQDNQYKQPEQPYSNPYEGYVPPPPTPDPWDGY